MKQNLAHLRPRRPVRRAHVAAAVVHLATQAEVRRRADRFAVIFEQESARRGLPSRPAVR